MNRVIQFSIFLSIFLIIYFSLHYYVFMRFSTLLNIKRTLSFYIIMLAFTISYLVVAILEKQISNIFTRTFYTISSVWMGILFFLFSSLIVYEFIRLVFKPNPFNAGITIVVIVLVLTVYSLINPFFIEIKEVEIPIKNLDKEIKLVQLSDVHIGTIRNTKFLQKIVKMTNQLKPDAVVITGDLVDSSGPLHEGMFNPLKKLNAPSFFVSGNHEIYEGSDKILQILNKTGIKILRNEVIDFQGMQIMGIDFTENKNNVKKMIPELNIDRDKPSILMHHAPVGVKEANKAGIDLMLAGHTHSGQIFPFTILVKAFYPYIKGLYSYNNTYLYVSPGTGTWGPPMRLGSRNEITLIKLKNK